MKLLPKLIYCFVRLRYLNAMCQYVYTLFPKVKYPKNCIHFLTPLMELNPFKTSLTRFNSRFSK